LFVHIFTSAVNILHLSSQLTTNCSTSYFHPTQNPYTINQQSLHSTAFNLCSGDVTISNLTHTAGLLEHNFYLFIYHLWFKVCLC